jgi:hypothetical protein
MGNATTNANWNATLNPIRDNMTIEIVLDTQEAFADGGMSLELYDTETGTNVPVFIGMADDGGAYIGIGNFDTVQDRTKTSITIEYPQTESLILKHASNSSDDFILVQGLHIGSIEGADIDNTVLAEECDSDDSHPYEATITPFDDHIVITMYPKGIIGYWK